MVAGHLNEAARIADRFPDLTLIIDHLGTYPPPRVPRDARLFEKLPELLALARYPNIAVKFTGVAALSTQQFPFLDLWPHLHKVIAAFGPERLMWGSDYTRTAALHTYSEAVNFLKDTNELSNSDKEQMFSGTIRRVLRWPSVDEKTDGIEKAAGALDGGRLRN